MPCELWASVLQGDGGVAANRLMTVPANGVPIVSNFYDAKYRRVKKAAFAGLGGRGSAVARVRRRMDGIVHFANGVEMFSQTMLCAVCRYGTMWP